MLAGLLDKNVQIVHKDLVEEANLTLAERGLILQHILGPLAQFEQAQDGGIGNRFLKVSILQTITGLCQGQTGYILL